MVWWTPKEPLLGCIPAADGKESFTKGRAASLQNAAHKRYFAHGFVIGAFTFLFLFMISTGRRGTMVDSRIGLQNDEEMDGADIPEPYNWKSGAKYSMIIPSLNRNDMLKSLLRHLDRSSCPSLAKIYVSWVNESAPLPDFLMDDQFRKYPIEVIPPPTMGLEHRFDIPLSLETDAVLSYDDDLRIPCSDLEVGFQTWRQFPDRIVGFVNRWHQLQEDGKTWKYAFPNSKSMIPWYSMILTDASFLHRNWLEKFLSDSPRGIIDFIEKHRNCEDIAMNFLVAHTIKKPPIYVSGDVLHYGVKKGAISSGPNHKDLRNKCVNAFSKYYGYMPLDYAKSSLKISQDTREQLRNHDKN